VTQDDTQDTRESPALGDDGGELRFTRVDAESIGDPAAAGTDAEGDPQAAPVEPAGDSPAAAHERAGDGGRPELQILGAFLGAFVFAQVLKRIFGRD
jgi:hypothetical protein